jgi:hypothetical protein
MNDLEKNEFIENHKWGGSGIERSLFEFILDNFDVGCNVIEFGSGYCSTKALSNFYNLYSIDENKSYVNIYENVNYLHADVIDGWYDKNKVIDFLPKKYDLVFVDGPLGEGNRSGILGNLEIFNHETIFIFHDTYRDSEKNLAIDVAKKLNKNIEFYTDGDYWAIIK